MTMPFSFPLSHFSISSSSLFFLSFFFLIIRRPPTSTLFPYTTPSDLLHLRPRVQLGDQAAQVHHRHVDRGDRKSTRLNSSHLGISYAVFCLKKKKKKKKCRDYKI